MTYLERMEESRRQLRLEQIRYADDFRNWPEERKTRHRYRRALHELLDHHSYPAYILYVHEGRLRIGPKEAITEEARAFMRQHRDDLVQWCIEHEGGCRDE